MHACAENFSFLAPLGSAELMRVSEPVSDGIIFLFLVWFSFCVLKDDSSGGILEGAQEWG